MVRRYGLRDDKSDTCNVYTGEPLIVLEVTHQHDHDPLEAVRTSA